MQSKKWNCVTLRERKGSWNKTKVHIQSSIYIQSGDVNVIMVITVLGNKPMELCKPPPVQSVEAEK